MTNEEIIQLVLRIGGTDGLKSLADDAEKASRGLEDTEKAAGKTGKASGDLGRSFLELGRVVQDFSQGGIGGILNNIEGLGRALGAGAGLAGVATLAGVAIATAGPKILEFFKGLSEKVDDVKSMKEQVEKVTEALDKFADKTRLTNKETAEYVRLAQEKGKLDEAEAKRKSELAGLKAQPEGPDNDRDLGKRVRNAVGGKQPQIAEDIFGPIGEQSDREFEAAHPDMHDVNNPNYGKLAAGKVNARMAAQADAAGIVGRAMNGDPEAIKRLLGLMPKGALRDELVRASTPDSVKADARRQGANFLDDTVGAFTRDLRDRNDANRAAREARENTFDIDRQTDAAKGDRDARAEAEQRRADAETMRNREAAERERQRREDAAARAAEQEVRDAPKKAEAAQLEQFRGGVEDVANSFGVQMTPEMSHEAARAALGASQMGVDAHAATVGAFAQTIQRAQQQQAQYARQMEQMQELQAQQYRMGFGLMPTIRSDTFFPGE